MIGYPWSVFETSSNNYYNSLCINSIIFASTVQASDK